MLGKQMKVTNGKILLAEPFMLDPNFHRSVVLLCDHHTEGSLGFILNKPLNLNISELVADFPEFKSNVHFGGPVATDTIHFIHNMGDLIENSVEISRGVYWGGEYEKLKFLIDSKLVLPHNIRFFVGYSGWGAGQLMDELEGGTWMTADMHANYIFKSNPRALWRQVMHNKGDLYTVIAQMPERISLN